MTRDDYLLEIEIIGSFINDNSTHELIDKLQEDDFIDSTNRKLIRAMKDLRLSMKEITIFSLADKTKISLTELAKITGTIATTANIEANIKLQKDKANRRKIIQKINIAQTMAQDQETDINELRNNILQEIQSIEGVVDEEITTLREAMIETSLLLDERYNSRHDTSLMTGIPKLDIYTAGLHPEELTTIGARPGVGKTILGMQIGLKIARNDRKVLYTSLEMSTTQLCERIIAAETNTDSLRLRTGRILDNEWESITKAASRNSLDNFLIDKSSRTPQHIRTKLRRYKPDLIIIDYLQLLQGNTREGSREREVATMTRDLKLMALEFKIPIILLSQLNRNAEGNRPSMADLRESGAIEQDSDNIIFIHEPNPKEVTKLIKDGIYSTDFFDKLEDEGKKLSQLIIEKQRNGPVGTIDVIKAPKTMRFIEIQRQTKGVI